MIMLMINLQNNLILKACYFLFIKKDYAKIKKATQYFHVFGSEDEATYHVFQEKLMKTY